MCIAMLGAEGHPAGTCRSQISWGGAAAHPAAHSATDCSAQCVPVQAKADEVQIEGEENVKAYHQLLQQAAETAADMRAVVNTPQHLLPFLQPGRLVQLLQPGETHSLLAG